jgi:hypothetical protein
LTVVAQALSETCLKWQRRSKVPPNARCVPLIRFLNAKGERPAEIHKQIVAVCGNVMNRHFVSSPKETSRWEKVRRR